MTYQEVSSDTILTLVQSIEEQIKNMSSTAEMETLITRLQESRAVNKPSQNFPEAGEGCLLKSSTSCLVKILEAACCIFTDMCPNFMFT